MLKYLSKQKKPILISTGMVSLKKLKAILKILKKNGNDKIAIMHCVSAYPAKNKILNLNVINTLKKNFNYPIGYSDHSLGEDACLAAVAKNVSIIEKHVTTSNELIGPDHKISMTIDKFRSLVKKIRNLEIMLGKYSKNFSKDELNVHKASRKSIVALTDINKGETITEKNLCFKRPGTGILPLEISNVVGKKARINIKKNRIIKNFFFTNK